MPTGVAPILVSILVTLAVGPRTFKPLKSSILVICLSRVKITPGPCTCTASSFTSLCSSMAFFCTKSQAARLVAAALVMVKGSSNTWVLAKRPAE